MTARLAKARLRGAQAPSLPSSDLRACARALRVEAMRLLAEAEGLDLAADATESKHSTDDGPLLGPADVGVTPTEWRAAIKRDGLRAVLIGRRLLARRSDVEAWLASRSVSAARVAAPDPAPVDDAVAAPVVPPPPSDVHPVEESITLADRLARSRSGA